MSTQQHQEGYDVEFVDQPTDAFQTKCLICLHVLRDPYQVNCCGKYFCRNCIQQIQARNKPCPACNQKFSTFEDKATRQALIKLQVHCKNHEAGCQWTGELGQLDQHLNENPQQGKELTGCEYVNVQCIHCLKSFQRCSEKSHLFTQCPEKQVKCTHADQGCNWEGTAKELEDHLNVEYTAENCLNGCEFTLVQCKIGCGEHVQRNCVETHENELCIKRPFSCDHCGNFKSEYDDVIHNHWPNCVSFPVNCPNKCNIKIKRQDIADHVDNDCPLTLIECDLSHSGCNVMVPRKHMPAHMIDNMSNHMTLLAKANYNLSKEVEGKDRKIKALSESIDLLQQTSEGNIQQVRLETNTQIAQLKRALNNIKWSAVAFAFLAVVLTMYIHTNELEERIVKQLTETENDLKRLRQEVSSFPLELENITIQISTLELQQTNSVIGINSSIERANKTLTETRLELKQEVTDLRQKFNSFSEKMNANMTGMDHHVRTIEQDQKELKISASRRLIETKHSLFRNVTHLNHTWTETKLNLQQEVSHLEQKVSLLSLDLHKNMTHLNHTWTETKRNLQQKVSRLEQKVTSLPLELQDLSDLKQSVQRINNYNKLNRLTRNIDWDWLHLFKKELTCSLDELLLNTTLQLTPPLIFRDQYTLSRTESVYIFYTHPFGFKVELKIIYPTDQMNLVIRISEIHGEFKRSLEWPEKHVLCISINISDEDAGVEYCTTINATLHRKMIPYTWTADDELNLRYKKNHILQLSIDSVKLIPYTQQSVDEELCEGVKGLDKTIIYCDSEGNCCQQTKSLQWYEIINILWREYTTM